MECLGWGLRICAEFTPVSDFFDEGAKRSVTAEAVTVISPGRSDRRKC
jgi:hypothetical protein